MADSSLDQFFAKKDKSKKAKTKSKVTSEQIAKKIQEDPGKKDEKSQKKDKAENSTGKEDEEWKDFEEEKERDYSGLRIHALTLAEKEKEEEGAKEGQMEDENADSPSQGEQQSGPWKVQSGMAAAADSCAPPEPEPEPEPVPEPEPKETKPTQPQAYRPPHLRSSSGRTQSTPGGGGGRRGNHTTYDFTSEEQFPCLGAAVDGSKVRQGESVDRSFTSVKHGLRNREDISQQHVKLDLENKYSALHQGDNN
ncbi:protein CDV3 homolog isoform X2 [Ornithodoros turicata]|uniref:protein CDV3 homolog isoform X2 n=1 Tax=Ornithodoros turicata TaxID=34597 RepID=UPI00313A4858